jgi:hypothetical protein
MSPDILLCLLDVCEEMGWGVEVRYNLRGGLGTGRLRYYVAPCLKRSVGLQIIHKESSRFMVIKHVD